MASHNDLGKWGEDKAAEYLLQNGFKILERNWRHKHCEIDIIATKNELLHFVEVKTRSTAYFGFPEESVTNAKQRKILEGAEEYIEEVDFNGDIQFNILAIVKGKTIDIEFFEDDFDIEEIDDEL